jgi:hypothetical protein
MNISQLDVTNLLATTRKRSAAVGGMVRLVYFWFLVEVQDSWTNIVSSDSEGREPSETSWSMHNTFVKCHL